MTNSRHSRRALWFGGWRLRHLQQGSSRFDRIRSRQKDVWRWVLFNLSCKKRKNCVSKILRDCIFNTYHLCFRCEALDRFGEESVKNRPLIIKIKHSASFNPNSLVTVSLTSNSSTFLARLGNSFGARYPLHNKLCVSTYCISHSLLNNTLWLYVVWNKLIILVVWQAARKSQLVAVVKAQVVYESSWQFEPRSLSPLWSSADYATRKAFRASGTALAGAKWRVPKTCLHTWPGQIKATGCQKATDVCSAVHAQFEKRLCRTNDGTSVHRSMCPIKCAFVNKIKFQQKYVQYRLYWIPNNLCNNKLVIYSYERHAVPKGQLQ